MNSINSSLNELTTKLDVQSQELEKMNARKAVKRNEQYILVSILLFL